MPDTAPIYTSRQLGELVRPLDRPQQFLAEAFFPGVRLFDTQRIDFHVINQALEVAQYVASDSSAKPRAERGYKIDSFEPAYIKELTPLKPSNNLQLRPGERVGGQMSPLERRAERVAQVMLDHESLIMRRVEQMCSEILATGEITVESDEFPAATVDFGRDAALTVALTSTARWGESGVSPMTNLRTWAGLVATKSGAVVDTCVMGGEAWELLIAEQTFRDRLDNRRGAGGAVEMFEAPKGTDAWGAYQGSIGGVDYWTYSQPYTEGGVAKNMMHAHGVILGSRRQMQGVRTYGAIMDDEALMPAEFWPKMYREHNPSRVMIETASAPLPVPSRVNACFYAQVR
jgi:hypothetical protein